VRTDSTVTLYFAYSPAPINDEINKISSNLEYQFIDNTLIGDDTQRRTAGGNIRTGPFSTTPSASLYEMKLLQSQLDPLWISKTKRANHLAGHLCCYV
jgi:hypothetical protein